MKLNLECKCCDLINNPDVQLSYSESQEGITFIEEKTEPHKDIEFRKPLQRAPATRRRSKVPVRDIKFKDSLYFLDTFYRFPARKQAILWESILNKKLQRKLVPDVKFKSVYTSEDDADPCSIPLNLAPGTVVLVHPTLSLHNLNPVHIYVPICMWNTNIVQSIWQRCVILLKFLKT